MKKKILCVILARGGSKSIPKKNIYLINNHPLISYSIQAAKDSGLISKIVVSTDDHNIAKASNLYGATTPFRRSKILSGDKVPSMDALRDAVIKSEKYFNEKYDYIIELPCVSPLRDASDVRRAVNIIKKNKYDSVISYVNTGEKHPIRLKRISRNKVTDFCSEYPEPKIGSRRQDFENCFIRNGAIYCMTRDCIVKKKSRMGDKSFPLIMPQNKSINIDEKFDLEMASLLIKNGHCKNLPQKVKSNTIKITKQFNPKKKNILITAPISFFNIDLNFLEEKFNCIFFEKPDKKSLIKYLRNVHGWICHPSPEYFIDKNILKEANLLEVISTPSTGITHIDTNYCKRKNIKVKSITVSKKFENIKASSEFTFLLCLLGFKDLLNAIDEVKSGNWRNIEDRIRGNEVFGKKVGIFGYGRIGKNLHKYFSSMNAKVSFFDLKRKHDRTKKKQILNNSDIIVMCISYLKKYYNFVNDSFFSQMKKNSIFVNTSRGEIVNENSLIKFLKNKRIKYAILDVVKGEQKLRKNNNILIEYSKNNKNLIITPHMAGLTYESEEKAFLISVDNIKKNFLNEKKN